LLLVHEGHANARRFFTQANARSYDSIVRFTTFGQDFAWKQEILQAIGRCNSVLELACGTGILSSMLVQTGKSVTGLDLTLEYLIASKRRVQLPVAQGTAEVLPYRNESFDAIVSSYLAKYVDMQRVADECWRVLRPGGVVVFQDFTYPTSGAMRRLWNTYFYILRMAGRLVTSWKAVFEQLDDVIRESDWVRQTENALSNRGFQNVSCRYHTAGTAAIVSAEKP
jgi:demethylmenaquinone methyltransferase / 2-methoxy-6-polyprenyl-1,4-benzoquinol methylase